MSTSARVSSNRFIAACLFWRSKSERKEPRGEHSGRCLSIALHPDGTDDSGQALNLSPNRSGFSYRCDFGGQQQTGPFCAGVRSCSNKLARLLMASAPLPRKIKFTGTSHKKRTIFQMESIEKIARA